MDAKLKQRLLLWLVACIVFSGYMQYQRLKNIKLTGDVVTDEEIGSNEEYVQSYSYDESGVQTENVPAPDMKANIGEEAINFVLTDMANRNSGKKIDFASFRKNKITIILFWDPHNPFSINQMETLNWMHDKRKRDKKNKEEKIRFNDVSMVGFVAFTSKETPTVNVEVFLAQYGIHFPHVLAIGNQEANILMQVLSYYKLQSALLPLTVVIDKKGIIRYQNSGFHNYDALVEQIKMIRVTE